MDKKKIIILLFLVCCIVGIAILFSLNYQAYKLIKGSVSSEFIAVSFQMLQKQISIVNIAFFIPMLILGLVWYYFTNSRNLIVLSNFLYIAVTIFISYKLNKEFNEINDAVATNKIGFWLFALIGLFSIIGAVLISVIGYISIRNLNNRKDPAIKKGRNKFNR